MVAIENQIKVSTHQWVHISNRNYLEIKIEEGWNGISPLSMTKFWQLWVLKMQEDQNGIESHLEMS